MCGSYVCVYLSDISKDLQEQERGIEGRPRDGLYSGGKKERREFRGGSKIQRRVVETSDNIREREKEEKEREREKERKRERKKGKEIRQTRRKLVRTFISVRMCVYTLCK